MVTDRLGFVSLRACLAILLEHRTLQNIQFKTLELLFRLTFFKKKKKSYFLHLLFIYSFFVCLKGSSREIHFILPLLKERC